MDKLGVRTTNKFEALNAEEGKDNTNQGKLEEKGGNNYSTKQWGRVPLRLQPSQLVARKLWTKGEI